MPKKLWGQISSDLLDHPLAADGALIGLPGEVLVVNATRTGFIWAQAGGAGSVGPANVLTIGTVTSGTSAAATITGNSPSQVLNLVLPKGDKGDQGIPGLPSTVPGPKGDTGATGPMGPGTTPDEYGNLTEAKITQIQSAGIAWIFIVNPAPNGDQRSNMSVPATIAGNMSGHMLSWSPTNGWRDYGIWTGVQGPQGNPGPKGDTGNAGPPPNLTVGSVSTGVASVTLSGTSPDYVLNFVLPAGVKGDQGIPGPKATSSYAALSSASINFAVDQADVVSRTITAATTWTFTNPPAAGTVSVKVLELTNGGAFSQTWPASVKWEGGVAPVLTVSGLDILTFYTRDGGTTYRGALRDKDSK